MNQQNQNDKEAATQLAIKKGLALVRRELTVVGLKADGSEVEIATSLEREDVWKAALTALQEQPKQMSFDDPITTEAYTHLHIFTDGGSRGNPGPSASGYVIMTTKEEILEEGGEYLGITTNNQAEYQAVKLALEQVAKYAPQKIGFFIDSLLVVNQMNGVWRIKNRELWPVHEAIKKLAMQYGEVEFTHVRREFNTLADRQVNVVLDSRS